jgi:DNA-binding transcriptional ArsR family regulator
LSAGAPEEEAKLLQALAHPLRRAILKEMRGEEEISPRELSERLEIRLSGLAYHVRILAECEAITLVRTRPVRGSTQHFYRFAIEAEWPYGVLGLSPPPASGE